MNSPESRRTITVASCLDPIEAGDTFSTWPPHIRLVPPFEADGGELHDIQTTIDAMASMTDTFTVTGSRQTLSHGDTVFRLLDDPRPLEKLHEDLLCVVEANTGRSVDSIYLRERYQPRVTYQKYQHGLGNGEKRTIRGIDVVEHDLERGDLKTVLAHYAFVGWKRLD